MYEYDQGGNILSKQKFVDGVETESTDFEYTNTNWRDQLTKVNGTTITYDQIGNPLNDGEWTYTWQNGRQLASMTNGETMASFVYNENGLRVQKTVNGVVTNYTLHGKNVVHLTRGNDELHFFYDASNKPAVVVFNGVPYSYVKNLQGDIVAILDSTGTVVVSYVYDAWGRPISKSGTLASTLGTLQPFRYRGYVYDEETGLYYLRSRYYCSDKCRFINEDSRLGTIRLIAHNAFCYCCNCPVMKIDSSGCTDAPAMPTPGPASTPTPRPSRPEGWDYEYRIGEQRRFVLEAAGNIVEAISDIARYAEAQQMIASGSGQITLKNGFSVYYISEDKYNEWYRERNSNAFGVLIDVSIGVGSLALGQLASTSAAFAGFSPWLNLLGILQLVNTSSEGISDVYIDNLLDNPNTIGLMYIPMHTSYEIFAWDIETLQGYFGNIKSVEPGDWYTGE